MIVCVTLLSEESIEHPTKDTPHTQDAHYALDALVSCYGSPDTLIRKLALNTHRPISFQTLGVVVRYIGPNHTNSSAKTEPTTIMKDQVVPKPNYKCILKPIIHFCINIIG